MPFVCAVGHRLGEGEALPVSHAIAQGLVGVYSVQALPTPALKHHLGCWHLLQPTLACLPLARSVYSGQ